MTDFPNGVNAPQAPNYAAPLLDFSPVGNIEQDVMRGQQDRRTVQQQRVFRNGIPKTPDGQNDYNAMTNKLLELSDFDNAGKIGNLGFQQQALGQTATNPESPFYQGGAPGGQSAPQASRQPGASPRVTSPVSRDERPARPDNGDGFSAPGQGQPQQAQPQSQPYAEPPNVKRILDQYDNPANPDIEGRLRNLGRMMANPYLKDYAKMRGEHLLKEQESTPAQKELRSGTTQGVTNITTAGKNSELTTEQKNLQVPGQKPGAGAPGVSAAEQTERLKRTGAAGTESDKLGIGAFAKDYEGLQAVGQSAFNGLQKAELAKNLIDNKNFYSGPLNKSVEMFRQFQATFGSDPAAALPQEAFQKVVNDMLTEQIKALGKSGVGRVLQVEVQNMQKSIASLGITPMANRTLLDTVSRVYRQSQDIAGIAREVQVATRGDPTVAQNMLAEKVNDYYAKHPLFTPEEKRDPRLVGTPEAPPSIKSPIQAKAWAQQLGLPPGYPVKWNGQIVAVP